MQTLEVGLRVHIYMKAFWFPLTSQLLKIQGYEQPKIGPEEETSKARAARHTAPHLTGQRE